MPPRAVSHLPRRIQDGIFYGLLISILLLSGWLVARHDQVADWTAGRRNSLSDGSRRVLAQLDGPLVMTSFAPENRGLRLRIDRLLQRYHRERPQIEIRYLDPELRPEESRSAGISLAGELLLEYDGRRETLRELSEVRITQAIRRLILAEPRWIVTLEGHGERRADGRGNHDLGDFATQLREEGFVLEGIDLATHPTLPENTQALVLTNPELALFPGEADRLVDYLKGGGNLLWLLDPGPWNGLESLARYLGVERLPGVVVDANAGALRIDDPSVALVPRYPHHPITRTLDALTLFPGATALRAKPTPGWETTPLLRTLERSWNETGPIRGDLERNAELGEEPGPLVIGLALTRTLETPGGKREQRVLVIGDGDFLSNAYLGNSANQDLGLRLIRWVGAADQLLDIPPALAPDRELKLSARQTLWLGSTVLVGLPLLFLLTGVLIRWWRQRA